MKAIIIFQVTDIKDNPSDEWDAKIGQLRTEFPQYSIRYIKTSLQDPKNLEKLLDKRDII